MSLKEKIQEELKVSLKERQEVKTATLRMLIAAILNKEKEKRAKLAKSDIVEEELAEKSNLTDGEIIEVVASEVKKRKEAISEFQKGKREDLAKKEELEMEILQEYLPEQLSEEEIRKMVRKAIDKVGAANLRDMGKVMAVLMPQIKGRAEGGLVSKIVKELLLQRE